VRCGQRNQHISAERGIKGEAALSQAAKDEAWRFIEHVAGGQHAMCRHDFRLFPPAMAERGDDVTQSCVRHNIDQTRRGRIGFVWIRQRDMAGFHPFGNLVFNGKGCRAARFTLVSRRNHGGKAGHIQTAEQDRQVPAAGLDAARLGTYGPAIAARSRK